MKYIILFLLAIAAISCTPSKKSTAPLKTEWGVYSNM